MSHPFTRVEHKASGRKGWFISGERRFTTAGGWVLWDDGGRNMRRGGYRPSWHPMGVLRVTTEER